MTASRSLLFTAPSVMNVKDSVKNPPPFSSVTLLQMSIFLSQYKHHLPRSLLNILQETFFAGLELAAQWDFSHKCDRILATAILDICNGHLKVPSAHKNIKPEVCKASPSVQSNC